MAKGDARLSFARPRIVCCGSSLGRLGGYAQTGLSHAMAISAVHDSGSRKGAKTAKKGMASPPLAFLASLRENRERLNRAYWPAP
jgi:hypothetical protein